LKNKKTDVDSSVHDTNNTCFFSVKLNRNIDQSEIPDMVLSGDIIIAKDLTGNLGLNPTIDSILQSAYGVSLGEIDKIHDRLSTQEILSKTEKLKLSSPVLKLEADILKSLFSKNKELFIELMPNLRAHIPYRLTLKNESEIEKKVGRGKMNAHGPHKDSWRYHPRNTINVWVSFSKSTSLNGMFVLPDSLDYYPSFANNEIVPGCEIYPDKEYITDLDSGDAVIFAAELLHGSILNQTSSTRFAFSMRCSVSKPEFHKNFMYNYIQVAPSFSNLTLDKILSQNLFKPGSEQTCSPSIESEMPKLKVVESTNKHLIIKTNNGLKRFSRYCPHKGIDLINGYLENDKLVCPQHRLRVNGVCKQEGNIN
jgi:hypothetical protein